jgi:hypothetical protein
MLTAIWFGWAFLCAWFVRVAVVALLPRRLGAWAYPLAYAWWPGLFVIGASAVEFTGFDLYGGNLHSTTHRLGAAILFLSPLGLPILAGAPFVVALDMVVIVWRTWINPMRPAD